MLFQILNKNGLEIYLPQIINLKEYSSLARERIWNN